MDGPWFATFADCPPLVGVKRGAVYRYGERVGDASMRDLALLAMRQLTVVFPEPSPTSSPYDALQTIACTRSGSISIRCRGPYGCSVPLNRRVSPLPILTA